jgi:phenylalanyl-tRNA synthetase beta chain
VELAGGEISAGCVDVVGTPRQPASPILLRLSQLRRVLGIDVPPEEVERILVALGCRLEQKDPTSMVFLPPSWRRDLSREIDLIEEVARIHGYENIPEDARVPMVPSHRADRDRVIGKLRMCLVAAGMDEALTTSVVNENWSDAFSPWTTEPALKCSTPMLRGADCLRRSLLPSLLGVRQYNEAQSNPVIELFETAKIYLPRPGALPEEPWMLSLTSGRSFEDVKGLLETALHLLNPTATWETADFDGDFLDPQRACWLTSSGKKVGLIGAVSATTRDTFGLRGETIVAELRIATFDEVACLIPQFAPINAFPGVDRDLNLVVDEALRWNQLASVVRGAAGPLLDQLTYRETYRDPKNRDGQGNKRLMFSMTFRHADRTLTGEEVDAACEQVIAACRDQFGARLL